MAETAKRVGMELEPVMSFHKCGGNVGDSCLISLPPWVLEEAKRIGRDKVFYCDRWVGGWVGGREGGREGGDVVGVGQRRRVQSVVRGVRAELAGGGDGGG